MSKQSLHQTATLHSGITYQESQQVLSLQPSIYERLGNEGLYQLSESFYDNVFQDVNNNEYIWFVNIFASSTKKEAVDNQYRFLVQTFGGDDLYRQKKGKYTRLAGRHANYPIGTNAANRWLHHMNMAIDEHELLKEDEIAKEHLKKYFAFTAHYIVAAKVYMRSDQLSGGTQIDPDRIW